MTFTVRVGGAKVLRAGLAVLALAYVGMAVLGPLLIPEAQPVGAGGRASGGAGAAAGVGARRGPGRPGGLHALLHARVEAVLPRVRARRARLPRGLAPTAPGEHGDQARDRAGERDRDRGAELRARWTPRPRRRSRPRAGAPRACAAAGGRAWRR